MSLPRASLASLAILLVLVSPACGGDGGDATDSTTDDTTAGTDDTTASTDDTTAGTGQPTTGEGDPSGAAIDAPAETWTWVPFPDAYCANGETTGIAVNLTGRSDRVVLYLEGGGACWDEATCYTMNASAHVADGYGEAEFAAEFDPQLPKVATAQIFDRDDPMNPFRDMSYVYVPYCTGDMHGGDNVVTYGERTTMHVGGANLRAYLERIVPTFADAGRAYLVGASAGGYGSTFHWWRVQAAFGDVRVDLVDDSGPPLDPPYLAKELSDTWRTQWNLAASMPPDCPECRETFGALYDYYGAHHTTQRWALLSYTRDWIVPIYFGFDLDEFPQAIAEIVQSRVAPHEHARYFLVDAVGHVLLTAPFPLLSAGVDLQAWLGQMVADDPAWASVDP
ncbi:pectin acetylesterase-family hydrolase [Nannocystis bainbridge]|uniref:Pectin acetylesterase-family hydrolase n=1 Tax=Nannocystis bainbridge TaxID=2995303 RepID=A0ABT5E4N6_9BACT|nr:pectin acetylesterase-family hydrolase [Nannocystis bainbridge]MDC0720829.1 pectin acetylesterase-family hydrolase [Nannocystis bainbridge]